MPSTKRPLDHRTPSTRAKKRRKINDSRSTVTNEPLRRSSRLKAMCGNRNKNTNVATSKKFNASAPLRRSSRIQQKREQSTPQIAQNDDDDASEHDIDMQDITQSLHEIEDAHSSHKTNPIYEPLPPPTTRSNSLASSSDYISLRSQMELGLLSSSDFRSVIHENELNDFWNNITSGQYSLQSVEPIFANSTSTDTKISAFTLHDTDLLSYSGTKDGNIGITNFTQIPYETITVRCHSDKITDIHTSSKRPLHVYTSGFDGKIKILDLMRIPAFQLRETNSANSSMNNHNNNTFFGDTLIDNNGGIIHGFDIKNGGREVYGVDNDGVLMYCDIRTHSNYQYQIAEKKIAAIRIHPLNDNYFVIAENKYKTLQLWDFRYIKEDKMQCVHQNKCDRVLMTVNWSENGERLLTCGRDDYIRVYGNALNTFKNDVMKMKHKNNTGIWICDYKPVFHPEYSEIVLTGNLDQKGIDVLYFGKDDKTKRYNIHDMTKVRGVHTFGAVHRRHSDYLFGVTYDKLVFYANIPCL
eukprot:438792_1